jgi:Transcriptional regulators
VDGWGTTTLALLQVANLLIRRIGPLFRKAQITPQQWALLSVLASMEQPPTLAGLSREMTVSKQNMTGMIARLEALGLVERAADSTDLRANRLTLSRRGQQLYERITPVYRAWTEEAFGRLPVAEQKAIQKSVARLLDALQG